MKKPKGMPEIPSLRCPNCTARMMPGFPLATPEPTNVTVCPSCDTAYRFGADVVLEAIDFEKLEGMERAQVDRMVTLCRACQGKGAKSR